MLQRIWWISKTARQKKKIILMYESYCCPPPTQMVRTPAATPAVVPSTGGRANDVSPRRLPLTLRQSLWLCSFFYIYLKEKNDDEGQGVT